VEGSLGSNPEAWNSTPAGRTHCNQQSLTLLHNLNSKCESLGRRCLQLEAEEVEEDRESE